MGMTMVVTRDVVDRYAGFLASVMPEMGFVPTGGINLEGAAAYLAIPHVIAIGGSWLVPGSVLAARDWRSIEELARECAALRDRT